MRRLALVLLPTLLMAQEARLDEATFAGDPKAVMAACAERIELLKGRDAKLLAEAGRFHLLAGRTKKGEELLRFADLLDPKDREVQRLIGLAYLRAGRRHEALDAYDKILQRDGGPRRAVAEAAVDLAEVGMAKDAERFMDAYVLMDSNDWEAFVGFGRALLKGGARRAAAAWFSRATFLKPKEERVYLEIGKAYADTGKGR